MSEENSNAPKAPPTAAPARPEFRWVIVWDKEYSQSREPGKGRPNCSWFTFWTSESTMVWFRVSLVREMHPYKTLLIGRQWSRDHSRRYSLLFFVLDCLLLHHHWIVSSHHLPRSCFNLLLPQTTKLRAQSWFSDLYKCNRDTILPHFARHLEVAVQQNRHLWPALPTILSTWTISDRVPDPAKHLLKERPAIGCLPHLALFQHFTLSRSLPA